MALAHQFNYALEGLRCKNSTAFKGSNPNWFHGTL
jgi:hypothetical protein